MSNILYFFRSIKWFFQRGIRGYADCDLWSFNDYLCRIIPPALRKLAKDGMGCPSEFFDEERNNDECHRWNEALETMAQGFEAAKYIGSMGYHKWVETEHGSHHLEIDEEAINNAKGKIEKGLGLFAKHFLSLWD